MKAWRLVAQVIRGFQRTSAFCAGLILCLTAGVLIDRLSCFSGVMILSEGINNRCLIPGTHVLSIEATGAHVFVDLESLQMPGLKTELLNYTPNALQKLKCTRENQITLFSAGNHTLHPTRHVQTLPIHYNNEKWLVAAIKTDYVGDVVADLSLQTRTEQLPLFALVQDDKLTEYVLTIGRDSEVSLTSLESLLKSSLVSLDEGRQGYGVQIRPDSFFKVWPTAIQLPSASNAEENTPCAHLCFTDDGQSEVLSLTYDPTATSFRWPLFNGKYLVRFQPLERTLPCSLQNKGWDQSQLSMIYFDPNGNAQEIALKVGEPYSTKEGYKFTLLKTPDETAIRIAVEYSLLKRLLGMCSHIAGGKTAR